MLLIPRAYLFLLFSASPCVVSQDCGAKSLNQGSCLDSISNLDSDLEANDQEAEDESGLLQVASTSITKTGSSQHVQAIGTDASSETCASLHNHPSFVSITLEIGTPKQLVELTVDTGSNALIVADCRCVEKGYCKNVPKDKCFESKDSSSESLLMVGQGLFRSALQATLTYGSGTIVSILASDIVRVAGTETTMEGGIFLMQDERQLDISGEFEGIFALGLPEKSGDVLDRGWAQVANVPRYALCFNGGIGQEGEGKFTVNMPSLPDPLPNIGTVHWGLDLQGISVGKATAPVLFCDPSKKHSKMASVCGAIPDSGTTLFMGPANQILALYEAICDDWTRCRSIVEANSQISKHQAFHDLLYNCGDWLTEKDGVSEMPSIYLHLAGRSYALSPWAYIMETDADLYAIITGRLFGKIPVQFIWPTGKTKHTCVAAFEPMDYLTEGNGPVWIFGTPLFYEYQVGFDISTKPEQISISDTPCSLCGSNNKPSLVAGTGQVRLRNRKLRVLSGPLRERLYNKTLPL